MFAQIFFLLLWKEGKGPKLHKFVQVHFWRFECFNHFIYNFAYVYIMIVYNMLMHYVCQNSIDNNHAESLMIVNILSMNYLPV